MGPTVSEKALVKKKTKKEIVAEQEAIASVLPAKPLSHFDTKYVSKDNLALIEACIDLNEPCLLIGETGTGKTTLIKQCADERKKKIWRCSVNGSMGTEELLGRWLVEKGSTYWQDGILTMAMRNGDYIVLDEINAALPEILFALHQLLDDGRCITLPEKDNEIVVPHPEFRFFASMNPPDEYAGTKDMNKALTSRFTAVIYVPVLSEVKEIAMLTSSHGADPATAEKLVRTASALRAEKKKDNIFYFCSTRDLVQVVVLMRSGMDLSTAFLGAVVNKMSLKEAEQVKSIISGITKIDTSHGGKTIEQILKENTDFISKLKEVSDKASKQITDLKAAHVKNLTEKDTMIRDLDETIKKMKSTPTTSHSAIQNEILKKISEAVKK